MTYRVVITPTALSGFDECLEALESLGASPEMIEAWGEGVLAFVRTLERFPRRFPMQQAGDLNIHRAVHGQYVLRFTVNEPARLVQIITIRHAARDPDPGS